MAGSPCSQHLAPLNQYLFNHFWLERQLAILGGLLLNCWASGWFPMRPLGPAPSKAKYDLRVGCNAIMFLGFFAPIVSAAYAKDMGVMSTQLPSCSQSWLSHMPARPSMGYHNSADSPKIQYFSALLYSNVSHPFALGGNLHRLVVYAVSFWLCIWH
ncbi:monocarboxylate transporter 2, partial [Lates japonicus]